MLEIKEIEVILKEVISEKKNHNNKSSTKYPEYWEGYNKAVEDNEKIDVHSVKGVFPEALFAKRSPNQTDNELDYIKDNYAQITLNVFADYINTRGRSWHKSNWGLTLNEDNALFASLRYQDYLLQGNQGGVNLIEFMSNVIPVLKARDAEGVLAIKPKDVNLKENEDGSFSIRDNVAIDPVAVYYSSKQIVHQSDDSFMIETKETSIVQYMGRPQKVGTVYEFYDSSNIYKVRQVGKKTDHDFEIVLYYNHNLGFVPVHKLMGVANYKDGQVRWESPFIYAVDNLNLVALDNANLSMSKAKCVYPIRIIAADVCEYREDDNPCRNGQLSLFDKAKGHDVSKTCPSCNGTGMKHRLTPAGEIAFDPKDMDEGRSNKLMEYVSPKVDTLQFLKEQIDSNEARAREILHLNTTSDEAIGGQDVTATSKAIENKALMAFIKVISDQEFTLFDFSLNSIGLMRYGSKFNGYTLHKPANFDFVTEEDYINQISTAKEAGVPPIALRYILVKYVKSVFGEANSRVIDLLVSVDRILELDSTEIEVKRASGLISKVEDVIHCSGVSIIEGLIAEDPNFLDKTLEDKKKLIIERAQLIVDSLIFDETDDLIN